MAGETPLWGNDGKSEAHHDPTDRQPWFDGLPRSRGEELKMPEKEAVPFIEKGFAEIVRGSDDGSESD